MNARIKKRTADSQEKFFAKNLKVVLTIMFFVCIALVALMLRWQVVDHEKWYTIAQSQYVDTQTHTSSRGTIYAGDGSILAIDEPAWGVYASLSNYEEEREEFFNNKDKFVAEVAGILGIEKEELSSKLTSDFVYVPIKHGVSTDKKKALEKIKISETMNEGFGLYFVKEEKRVYPDKNLASHVLGFIGKDENGEDLGQYGIEGYYFRDMIAQQGYTYEEKDSRGNVILTAEYDPVLPRQGKSIKLTIIPLIQQKVQDSLKEAVETHRAKSGTAIIMNPKTGAIIAMANYPDFDPNEYWKTSSTWIYKNTAVSDVYEFGSVQKPVTIAIGLESGKIPDDYICSDPNGYIELYDKKIYTASKRAYGDLSLTGILQYSHNPCAAKVALDTGFSYYYQKLEEFGYGQFIGTGLEGESTSYLMPYEEWTKLDLAVTAFGQSISATPLQVLSAISTIANNGVRMKPYIVSEIVDDKETITYTPKVLSTPVSETTADKVANMMQSVVRAGDPRYYFNTYLPNYNISGKTGTSQVPKENEAGYYDDRVITTFVGFAPTEDPQMVMIVKLQEPKTSIAAAYTAAPAWGDIFQKVADDLGIPKTR